MLHLLLPDGQRRAGEELVAELDLYAPGAGHRRSAFWTMLTLSALIATAGVLADSTATVIGAMIIAPLSTPILGTALGLARGDRGLTLRSAGTVVAGVVLVVALGAGFSLALPSGWVPLADTQIAGRTSPGLLDLVAAVATGFAGTLALARRDLAAVLPGVAIAISLVPPLAVVGVCLGLGQEDLALGALLLFVSNLLALVLAGSLVFAATGYARAAVERRGRRRATLVVTALLLVVGLPLAVNTALSWYVTVLTARVQTAAEGWLAGTDDASLLGVTAEGWGYTVEVLTASDDLPPLADLREDLRTTLPSSVTLRLRTTVGSVDELPMAG